MNAAPRPSAPLRLHRLAASGHCHRVELLLSMLDLPYTVVEIDLPGGEHKQPAFLALNALGQVPVIEDGELVLPESNAILVYLASRYAPDAGWLPRDALEAAWQQRWFSLSVSLLGPGAASPRYRALTGLPVDPASQALGHTLFARVEEQLSRTAFLVADRPMLADLSFYGYTAQAPIGGVSLSDYPRLRGWLRRIEALPGFVPLPDTL
ncbi:glutathione S-transferase [Mitsuaria sp. GD03876]|uniref:glutathione S-transferase family protein n=1 Tax=Mitsuaria sp. GD03876 TaxID=2975399 RepID=UPI002449DE1A|nr:glutathione S-transferase [Mitsuaria sp. GD03876]MDH0863559.1 glutathione S-transferase N-terminal domain-containing protein [Mitsuaria sp. GD03876]